ncbi:DNA polymerase I [Viridibacillus sp. FSL R5-0477]|uniref:DNA polymerase I n=1 Tax=Viridibacillus arenosi FSL R5-213 TaxID=1227360 RepID=W4EQR8_9BACL|nr:MULTISPECIES: DNA polymerase I [Viridibacillus]ETT82589.1 DNA polymerase I [Viridibacillus arenosi FSL R5-213]OMC85554.1 DNA polymerase I [Viridibacillus sp. FSL H8-0123]OMC87172.1 DNA polymerase I [Viridibacillus sp. FSL H7-0596]OMC92331.1 DNA polymerase I [Viridibacillus arenosi]
MTKEKLLLLDGNSLAYRAFFALPLLTNDSGIHTNAVYGFTTMLQKILEEEKPTKMLVAFDAGKTTFRHSTYGEYKGGRQKTPPELSEQFPYLRKLLDAYCIKQYELEMYEADDIIGTLSKQAEEQKLQVIVVSGDKDLTQLASDNTTVYITRKGMTDIEKYTPDHIQEKYGLTPEQIIDMKGLMGDASDNIPGVPGVGEKTAIKLLKQYPTIEELYENVEQVSGAKLKEKLTTNEEQAKMSKQLATIDRQSPITITLDELVYDGPNVDELFSLWQDLSFKSLIEKSEFQSEATTTKELTFSILEDVSAEQLQDAMAVHIELADEHYHTCDRFGIALVDDKQAYYIPYDKAMASISLKEWLEDASKQKFMVDSKAAQAALLRDGIKLAGVEFDMLLAAYIVNPAIPSDDVATISKEFGYTDVLSNDNVYGKGAKKATPAIEAVAEHACRKANAVFSLQPKLEQLLRENEQFELYKQLELPLAAILSEMESEGITVDRERLVEMGHDLTTKLKTIEEDIYSIAGQAFNINSPKQLGVILFEKLGLPVIKKTKTGYSTAADVLEKLEPEHEIIRHILQYRQLGKLQSTYIEGLLKEIHEEDQKIHTRFQQALTSTGRLSSTDPNLQNIPVRLEEGRKIRQAFVPSNPEWLLFAADYSQIELRVLAHMCGDENLINAFQNGLDIHTNTAMNVFHVAEEEVTSDMRRAAKAVNFGIVYGISDYGLSQNLDITRKEAADFIERYFASFPGVQDYMKNIVEEAKQQGYVTTMLNRRRYLPDLKSSNFNLRSFAERTAMNTPIQGSAADIIKKAMIDMAAALKEQNLQTKMLLQVHDELIFEAPKEEIAILEKLVPEVMGKAFELNVPLRADFAFGPTWYDTK